MKRIQITLDDELLETVDQVVEMLKTTRSTFARAALKDALAHVTIEIIESRHKKGYGLKPAVKNEFSLWEKEQQWGNQ